MHAEELGRTLTGRMLDIWRGHDDSGRLIDMPAEQQEEYRSLWRNETQPNQISDSVGDTCRHFTDTPLDRGNCGSCQTRWVYPCDVYGKCSPDGMHARVQRCRTCPHHRPRGSDAPEPHPTRLILHNDLCPGDVLVMSAAVASLHMTHRGKYITAVTGTAPELFDHNPHVVAPESTIDGESVSWRTIKMEYPLIHRCDMQPVHFMHGYCAFLEQQLGVPVPLLVNRPYLYLAPDERGWMSQIQELTGSPTRYWLVNAGYKDDYPTKFYGTANYQKVIDLLRGKVQFVQIGETNHNHAPLAGVIDMRGKTDIRQLVRMVYHASGGIGPSTFLQHLCAAFEKPYVCIAGGREPLAWQHYPLQCTLSTIGVTPCSASRIGRSCWKSCVTHDPARPDDAVCELPTVSTGGAVIPGCLESIRPERVVEEVLARYNNGTTFR